MAKKPKTVFVCQECGYESPKWMGQCICGAWSSMVEEKVVEITQNDVRRRGSGLSGKSTNRGGRPSQLKNVGSANRKRLDTGIGELNRVLGHGMVKGSLTLISGEPGIGKSTLIIQAAENIARKYGPVLYVSGEESEEQIKMRADRVCGEIKNLNNREDAENISDNLFVLAETNMENIMAVCETVKPEFLIVDSIQTMYTQDLDSAPGSVSQVRACGNMLMQIGKSESIPIFIVAHVTKSGELAGPKIVEHLVDCVLNFAGERDHEIRILRAFKNRFGTTSEIGAFRMAEEGLIEIENLSGSFLENADESTEGSVITAVYEGSRPVFLEIQALVTPANVGFARRTAVGIDNQRLSMILAVLEKKQGINLLNQDVYVNVVGGIKPDSTSVDLGVALAVYSSMRGKAPAKRTAAIGEVGLTGDLRSVSSAEKIAAEALRLGYERIIMPLKNAKAVKASSDKDKGKILGAKNLHEAVRFFAE
ncbi:MAG: DNA repair protein RadA [Hornefia sp.]|nr:DNA repair protein RadA [Hornefia sp.]